MEVDMELLTEHPCTLCKHYRWGVKCSAYPNGIPDTLVNDFDWGMQIEAVAYTAPSPNGTNDHRLPINGDNGMQWQCSDDELDIELRTAWWGEDRSKWPVNPHGR